MLKLFYDSETTGLPNFKAPSSDPAQPHLVQVAASLVDEETRAIVAAIDLVVRPNGWNIPDEVARVHGITNEIALARGIDEAVALTAFYQLWLQADSRIAHNQSFDERILRALRSDDDPSRPIGPRWLRIVAEDITALGSATVLGLAVTAVVGFLALNGLYKNAAYVLIASLGGWFLNDLFKSVFARPRPSIVPHLREVFTLSFPSGHALTSAVVYLTLGALLARTQTDRKVKTYVLGVAVLLTVLVGVSRVYLGVHWPTDVLAGWALGGVWALICLLVMGWLQARGQVEDETAGEAG